MSSSRTTQFSQGPYVSTRRMAHPVIVTEQHADPVELLHRAFCRTRRRAAPTLTDTNWSVLETDIDRKVTLLERAFQFAKSDKVSTMEDIRKTLKQEGLEQEGCDTCCER